MKDLKKVEAGRHLAAHNRKKREMKAQSRGVNQYYGTGAVIAVGVIGGLGYYIYQTKKGGPEGPQAEMLIPYQIILLIIILLSSHHGPYVRLTSSKCNKSLMYYKNGQEEYSK